MMRSRGASRVKDKLTDTRSCVGDGADREDQNEGEGLKVNGGREELDILQDLAERFGSLAASCWLVMRLILVANGGQ